MWNEFSSFVKSLLARAAVLQREEGQGLIEYALIIALISVVAIALLTTIGSDVVSKLAGVTSAL